MPAAAASPPLRRRLLSALGVSAADCVGFAGLGHIPLRALGAIHHVSFAPSTKPGDTGAKAGPGRLQWYQRQPGWAPQRRRRRRHERRHPSRLPTGCSAILSHRAGQSPRTAALDRQDTPYPGWDQQQQQGKGEQLPRGKPAPPPHRRAHPPAAHPAPLEEGAEEAEGEVGSGAGASARTAAVGGAAAGSPPAHPHHAGHQPPPMLDAEHGGSVADDVLPPLGDADQP